MLTTILTTFIIAGIIAIFFTVYEVVIALMSLDKKDKNE